eukprot:1157258-Pelagomonas_calceolata.AAC.9
MKWKDPVVGKGGAVDDVLDEKAALETEAKSLIEYAERLEAQSSNLAASSAQLEASKGLRGKDLREFQKAEKGCVYSGFGALGWRNGDHGKVGESEREEGRSERQIPDHRQPGSIIEYAELHPLYKICTERAHQYKQGCENTPSFKIQTV